MQLDLNFDSLKDYLMGLREQIHEQGSMINILESEILRRTTEVVVGKSLERISMSVSRKLGERPHAFKLDDPSFLNEENISEESKVLKTGVEKMVEKMEIMSKQLLN